MKKKIIQPLHSKHLSFRHYPILSAFFKKYGLFEFFDFHLPKKRHFFVSHAQCLLLFVCDCLTSRTPLYLYKNLVEDLDVEMIFGPSVRPEHLNEDAMGETLDAIKKFGVSKLFSLVLQHLRSQTNLDLTHLHVDTTNFSVAGEYYGVEDSPSCININFGHPKDMRTDLKRWALMMIVNAQGIPVAMKALDGNSSDNLTIIEGMKALAEALGADEVAESIFIADSSFYTKANITSFDGKWVTHAQDKLKEVRRYQEMPDLPFVDSQAEGYKLYGFPSSYGDVEQRWVLVHSQQMYKLQEKTLQKKQEKHQKAASAEAYHLKAETFKCEPDALSKARSLIAKWPLLKAMEPEISSKSVKANGKRGRPKKGEESEVFSVIVTFAKDPLAFEEACRPLGKFMLATNDLTLTDEDILQVYKQQGKVERGFRFLKDGTLRLTPVFLKSPGRIEALSFVMCFTLMVYAILENQLREALAKKNETIHIQDAGPADYKDNAKPTLKKVFVLFEQLGTNSVTMPGGERLLIRNSLPPEVIKVLYFLGPDYLKAFDRRL